MGVVRRRPLGTLGALLILIVLLATACSSSTRAPGQVHVLTWHGDVNQIMVRYVDRGISTAEKSNAAAVVLRLDTPGGLDTSMRDVIKRIEASKVPVIVYVAPAGGRAASAGTFITMAGHVAAMAPNTSIGAATPINSNGSDIQGALGRKVENDAVAYIRSIAELRGRNADWAESAVRDAVAASADQAVELNVVDFIATGLPDLLKQSDGRQVQVMSDAGAPVTVTLHTADAPVTFDGTNLFEQLLYAIADPNIAFALLLVGGIAIVIEVITPGFGIGVFGAIMLILAYFSLAALPTNWVGVALVALGLALLLAEVFIGSFGLLGFAGIVSLSFGGLFLTSSSQAGYEVSRWLVFGLAIVAGVLALLLATALLRVRRMSKTSGPAWMIGAKGRARTSLEPDGIVRVRGELWEATADDPPLEENADIVVTRVEGLHVWVKRDPSSVKLLPAAQGGDSA